MNLLRQRLVRLPIVAIGVAAWLVISNHCALAAFEARAKTPVPSCHESPPTNHAPANRGHQSGVECCKVLRATLLTFSSNLVENDTFAVAALDGLVAFISAADESRLTPVIEWDTGPPARASFAETVLQRSLLAHAPPRLA